jgi:hypothetical protein
MGDFSLVACDRFVDMLEVPKTDAHGGVEERFVASLVKVGDGHAAGINELESLSWSGHSVSMR